MTRLLPVAALVVSVAALATAFLHSPAPAAARVEASADHADELAALSRRLDLVEETQEHIEGRIADLYRKPAYAMGDAGAVPAQIALEVAQLRSEVQGMIAGEALQSEGGKAYLRDAVRGVQEELQVEERKVRAERFEAQQVKQQAEQAVRWKKFVTDAQLDYTQEQTLNRALEAETANRKKLMDEMRAGTRSFGEIGPEMRASREQTDAQVKAALKPEQFQKYTEQRREDRRGGGGGGRGQRGSGNDNGG